MNIKVNQFRADAERGKERKKEKKRCDVSELVPWDFTTIKDIFFVDHLLHFNLVLRAHLSSQPLLCRPSPKKEAVCDDPKLSLSHSLVRSCKPCTLFASLSPVWCPVDRWLDSLKRVCKVSINQSVGHMYQVNEQKILTTPCTTKEISSLPP